MPKVSHLTPPLQAAPVPHDGPGHAPGALPCRYCGVIDRPTLSPGTGPHAIRADCPHCGKFLKWISVLSPTERVMHRAKAMQQRPPSQVQLDYLQALGDTLAQPATMAEASTRIDRLLQERKGA